MASLAFKPEIAAVRVSSRRERDLISDASQGLHILQQRAGLTPGRYVDILGHCYEDLWNMCDNFSTAVHSELDKDHKRLTGG